MTRTLITGATGFVGGHLAELLLERGDEVVGTSYSGRWPAGLAHLADRVRLMPCDVTVRDAVRRLVVDVRPRRIYHLAAVSNVPDSFFEPDRTWQVNLEGTRNVLEAAVVGEAEEPGTRVLFVGSSAEYGRVAEDRLPIVESTPLRPTSPYAASKAAADLMSFQYATTYELAVVRVRPFNHIGPRQTSDYAVAHFAHQIARLARTGRSGELRVGNLDVSRDLTDVRDVVRAYVSVLEAAAPGDVYNVASGRAVLMRDVVDHLIRLAGVSNVDVRARADLLRPDDVPVVYGDASALKRLTGWAPHTDLEQTLRDTLAYWNDVLERFGSMDDAGHD